MIKYLPSDLLKEIIVLPLCVTKNFPDVTEMQHLSPSVQVNGIISAHVPWHSLILWQEELPFWSHEIRMCWHIGGNRSRCAVILLIKIGLPAPQNGFSVSGFYFKST